jgi:serine/tyrosine/threonine adenylyltransferase
VSLATEPLFAFETSYLEDLKGLYEPWQAAPVPAPELVVLNDDLAHELGLDPDALRCPEAVAVLAGNATPEGSAPVALAYAGHQFGSYSPRLGDGRALLLGELVDDAGRRRDLHLKGSGRTPFARGGDGKAALGPMLREHLISEAMHALRIPTTRSLAGVATGEPVARETMLPGAILVRVAGSHLRVGTFEYAAARGDHDALRRLADHAIDRHHPAARAEDNPYLALFEAVVEAQASLVARWMLVGFIHGVMNTDNMTISGETIDYGPCAFMDAYDPATVFSSIDHGGRYAYGNQPPIAQWNLARLAEALLPLLHEDTDAAVALALEPLRAFPDRYRSHWQAGMRAKLGLTDAQDSADEAADDTDALITDLLALLHEHGVDHTAAFRSLSSILGGDPEPARDLYPDRAAFDAWRERWQGRVTATADDLDAVNPVYIPRNHLVEEALEAATAGDTAPFHGLLEVLQRPFDRRPGLERYEQPAPAELAPYRTFCGT